MRADLSMRLAESSQRKQAGVTIQTEPVTQRIKPRTTAEPVSELTTNRLSIYLRCLDELAADGVRTISSQQLAARYDLNAAQIRKDLAFFGEFGVRGVGYAVQDLAAHLRQILGLGAPIAVAVVGAGNLGQALADYPGFPRHGFHPVALFDRAAAKVGGTSRGGVPIYHVRRLPAVAAREGVRIAMIAVPAGAVQQVVNQVAAAGLRAILNFAPGPVRVPPGVRLKNVDLTVSLEGLAYHLANMRHAQNS